MSNLYRSKLSEHGQKKKQQIQLFEEPAVCYLNLLLVEVLTENSFDFYF